MVGLQSPQRVRVYRLYLAGESGAAQRMQICVEQQLCIDDFCVRAVRGSFEINVWPMKFALFEAISGEMVRVPQEQGILEMATPSYWSFE